MTSKLSLSLVIGASLSGSVASVFGALSSSINKITEKLQKVNKITDRIDAYKNLKKRLSELNLAMKRGGEISERAKIAWRETAERLREVRRELEKAGISVKELSAKERQLAEITRRLNTQMSHLSQANKFAEMRRSAFSGWQTLAASGLALAAPIRSAIDFESAMADVRKVVNFASNKEFAEFQKTLMRLSKIIPISQAGLAQIAAAGGQLGVAVKDLPKFIELSAKMAVAFDMSADQAGDAMAKLSNIFQIPIIEVGKLGDAINHLSNNTAAKASEIVNVLRRVGGVAKQFGLTANEAAALADAFISLGKTPEIAGTAINGMLSKLATADKQGKQFQEALASIGVSAVELKEAIIKNPQKALVNFLEMLKEVPKAERMSVLTGLFGMEYADDIAVLVGSLDKYKDALRLVSREAQYAGSMQKEFESRAKTTANNLQLLKNRLNALAINVGSVILPAFNWFVGIIGAGVDKISEFMNKFPKLSKFLIGAASGITFVVFAFKALSMLGKFLIGGALEGIYRFRAGLEGLRLAILALRGVKISEELTGWRKALYLIGFQTRKWTGIIWENIKTMRTWRVSNIKSAFTSLIGVFPRLIAGVRAFNLAIISNPIGLAVAGIVAGALLVYKYWDYVKSFFKGLFSVIKKELEPLGGVFKIILSPLKLIWEGLKFVGKLFGFVGGKAKVAAEGLAKAGRAGAIIGKIISVGLMPVLLPIKMISAGIKGLISGFKKLANIGKAGIKFLFDISPIGVVYNAFKKMREYLKNFSLLEAGKKIIESLWNGIKQMAMKPINAIKHIAGKIRNFFPFSPAKEGPLRDLHKVKIIETVIQSVKKSKGLEDELNEKLKISGIKNVLFAKIKYAVDKLKLPKAPGIFAKVRYGVEKFKTPEISDITKRIRFIAEKINIPKIPDVFGRIRYIADKLKFPKIPDIFAKIRFVMESFEESKIKSFLPSPSEKGFELREKVREFSKEIREKTIEKSKIEPGQIIINLSPNININGDANRDDIKKSIDISLFETERRLKEEIEKIFWNEKRLSYA